ncbi:Protein kinase-like domain protein [Apiospora hydei]|uniref:cyclin-dependent kinase n=1 Tax=Apiospora hydei TaxID=1337664 RepID=A0ABR1V2B9_9PEZI
MAHLHHSHHTMEWPAAVGVPSSNTRQMTSVRRHRRAHKLNTTKDSHHPNHPQGQLPAVVSRVVAFVEVASARLVEVVHGVMVSLLRPSMLQRVRLLVAIFLATPVKTRRNKPVHIMQARLIPTQLPITMSIRAKQALHGHFTILTMKMRALIGWTIPSRCHHQLVLPRRDRPLQHLLPALNSALHSSPPPRPRPLPPNPRFRRNLVRRLLEGINLLMTEIIEIIEIEIFPVARLLSLLPRERDPTISAADSSRNHSSNARLSPPYKKIRRPKPRPQLPSEHVRAESVYFRKPGNESVVGSGTYGKVFKGTNVYTKKLVALKKIRMEGERDGFPVTAVREIKLLQSLKHENIVNLMEVMVEDNSCYMVFEYLSHDLTGLLNHPSYKLDPAEKKHMAKQLFEGLDYLHGRGDGILKLADFGLARFYAKHHRLDYTNRVITIWYRSPELLLGETQYTAAVDVWSAACVMVEIFTRHAIFPGDGTEINQLDKIYAILGTPNKVEWPDLTKMEWFELLRPNYRKPNVFAEKYKERVPAAAFDLLTSMFHYDPARRPTAAEVLEHAYFTTEQPPPRQATALADIQGDWHEFESKALRRAKEKQEREARQAAREVSQREKDKKRPIEVQDARKTKRPHLEGQPPVGGDVAAGEAMVE